MPTTPASYRAHERRREREQYRGTRQERGYDEQWLQLARWYRAQHPVCQICNEAPSVDVDHIIPFGSPIDPLRTRVDNLQALCRMCHSRKTRLQSAQSNDKSVTQEHT